jgi:hypothetical protein
MGEFCDPPQIAAAQGCLLESAALNQDAIHASMNLFHAAQTEVYARDGSKPFGRLEKVAFARLGTGAGPRVPLATRGITLGSSASVMPVDAGERYRSP